MSHEKLLKLCSYKSISEIYARHKYNQSFKAHWKIVNECYNALSKTNDSICQEYDILTRCVRNPFG